MPLTRRQLLTTAATAAATTAAAASFKDPTTPAPAPAPAPAPFRFCLNTSTIRGQKLSLPLEIDLAGKVGYTGI